MIVDYRDDPGSTGSNGNVTLTRMPLFGSDANGTFNDIFNVTIGNLGTGDAGSGLDDTPGEGFPWLGIDRQHAVLLRADGLPRNAHRRRVLLGSGSSTRLP